MPAYKQNIYDEKQKEWLKALYIFVIGLGVGFLNIDIFRSKLWILLKITLNNFEVKTPALELNWIIYQSNDEYTLNS